MKRWYTPHVARPGRSAISSTARGHSAEINRTATPPSPSVWRTVWRCCHRSDHRMLEIVGIADLCLSTAPTLAPGRPPPPSASAVHREAVSPSHRELGTHPRVGPSPCNPARSTTSTSPASAGTVPTQRSEPGLPSMWESRARNRNHVEIIADSAATACLCCSAAIGTTSGSVRVKRSTPRCAVALPLGRRPVSSPARTSTSPRWRCWPSLVDTRSGPGPEGQHRTTSPPGNRKRHLERLDRAPRRSLSDSPRTSSRPPSIVPTLRTVGFESPRLGPGAQNAKQPVLIVGQPLPVRTARFRRSPARRSTGDPGLQGSTPSP
jgi:hypothetical protein